MARDGRGRFQRGYDPARHILTTEERQKGFANALAGVGGWKDGYSWLLFRVKRDCRRRRPTGGADQQQPDSIGDETCI